MRDQPTDSVSACRAGVAGLVALAGRSRPARPVPRAAERPNILLVTIDTLRADHVGCYGRTAALTPTLDGLAARGVALRHRGRARPSDRPLARLDPHRPDAARPRLPGQRRLRAARQRPHGGRGFRAAGLPDRRLRLRASRSTAASASTAASSCTTTTCRRATTLAARSTSSDSPTRQPTRRCAGWRRTSPRGSTARSSCGSTTTTHTRRTSRPGSLRVALPDEPVRRRDRVRRRAARARPARGSSARGPRPHAGTRDRRSRREPRRARRGSPTDCSSTTRRSGCPSSWPGRASPRVAWRATMARGDRRASDAARLRRAHRAGRSSRAARFGRRSRAAR